MKEYLINLTLDDQNSSHFKIVNMIAPNSKVFDVGCAAGYFGEYLFKEMNCEMVGLDINPVHIAESQKTGAYKALFNINLDDDAVNLDEYNGYFDYILLADVVEHLYNPQKIIAKLKPLLNPNGRILFSIPNISHACIKLKLLNNLFEYTQYGLLDSTHIRFFTLDSIIKMFNNLEMQIEDMQFVYYGESTFDQKNNVAKFPKDIIKYIQSTPQSYIYQYILAVKPSLESDFVEKNNHFVDIVNNDTEHKAYKYNIFLGNKIQKEISRFVSKIKNKMK